MTWTLSDSGTSTATLGQESTLATDTNNGTFVLEVDTSNMIAGDLLEIRCKTITLNGGSLVQAWKGTYQHTQINNHKISPPLAIDQEISCSIKQITGTVTLTTPPSSATSFADGSTFYGQSSSGHGIVHVPGGGALSTTAGSAILQVYSSQTLSSGETIVTLLSTTVTAVIGRPIGETYPWKILRI